MTVVTEFFVDCQNAIDQLELTELEQAFASFIYQHERSNQRVIALLAGLVSQSVNQQHSCLFIDRLPNSVLQLLAVPNWQTLGALLSEANCVSVADEPEPFSPLVLDQNRLYLQRYYHYEVSLAAMIKRQSQAFLPLDVDSVNALLDRLFERQKKPNEFDWQRMAVSVAVAKKFALITGGPGTGKTTTVAKLLAVLSNLMALQQHKLNVQLVAPTGKAAARLSESLAQAKQRIPEEFHAALDVKSSTIHRLLGSINQRVGFRYNQSNKLHLDVLIVDEASMVDLPLMCKLFDALPNSTRVILLGDHNQLSSVEAGSVLSDIHLAAQANLQQPVYSQQMMDLITQLVGDNTKDHLAVCQQPSTVTDSVVSLQVSHRFSDSSYIGQLAKSVIAASLPKTLSLLLSQNDELTWHQNQTEESLARLVVKNLQGYFDHVSRGQVEEAYRALATQQVLCASKQGQWGVESINHLVEKELAKQGMIASQHKNYSGRPIMLTSNDHSLGLYNGDIGIVMDDPLTPSLSKAWFIQPDGIFKGVLISRLPSYQTVYAMTIHKSQGSEFDNIYLCLPDSQQVGLHRGLSIELFYTGLTRAKKRFTLYGSELVLRRCLNTHCMRASGLAHRL